MHRVAIFVDAGHYFAHASRVAFGERVPRNELSCDHAKFVDELMTRVATDMAIDSEPTRILRVYWYDGAPNGVATETQLEVGRLANVKLRIGRLAGKRQKGVDGLIILDLVTLARERAIDTAFILSGDEDLREAVAAAQQFGIRVVLLGIPPEPGKGNQAESLIREADRHLVLDEPLWGDHLSRTVPLTEAIIAGQEPLPLPLPEASDAVDGDGARVKDIEPPLTPEDADAIAQSFLVSWLAGAAADDVVRVGDARPRIPGAIDSRLLEYAWEINGHQSVNGRVRRSLREAFWRHFTDRNRGDSESSTDLDSLETLGSGEEPDGTDAPA